MCTFIEGLRKTRMEIIRLKKSPGNQVSISEYVNNENIHLGGPQLGSSLMGEFYYCDNKGTVWILQKYSLNKMFIIL